MNVWPASLALKSANAVIKIHKGGKNREQKPTRRGENTYSRDTVIKRPLFAFRSMVLNLFASQYELSRVNDIRRFRLPPEKTAFLHDFSNETLTRKPHTRKFEFGTFSEAPGIAF